MAIAENKKRIAVTLTTEQEAMLNEVATEMGITKSVLVTLAITQYVTAYKQSKNIISGSVKDFLEKMIAEKVAERE